MRRVPRRTRTLFSPKLRTTNQGAERGHSLPQRELLNGPKSRAITLQTATLAAPPLSESTPHLESKFHITHDTEVLSASPKPLEPINKPNAHPLPKKQPRIAPSAPKFEPVVTQQIAYHIPEKNRRATSRRQANRPRQKDRRQQNRINFPSILVLIVASILLGFVAGGIWQLSGPIMEIIRESSWYHNIWSEEKSSTDKLKPQPGTSKIEKNSSVVEPKNSQLRKSEK